ncbi:hypothetical protein [Dendronalium phyllosphericum]|uniref:hypothetical protein n=1 Tax=Dendronalium phyllosphericum TaxID=2840445 RepID=UPI001BDD2055
MALANACSLTRIIAIFQQAISITILDGDRTYRFPILLILIKSFRLLRSSHIYVMKTRNLAILEVLSITILGLRSHQVGLQTAKAINPVEKL